MDNSGNAVIAYAELGSSDRGIYANRLSAAGSLSGRITVQDVGGVFERFPSVALAPSGGQFVVAYDNTFDSLGTELENFLDFLLVFRLSEVSGSSFRRTWVTCECFAVPAAARPACLAPLAVV